MIGCIVLFQNFTPNNNDGNAKNEIIKKKVKIAIVPVFETELNPENYEFCFRRNNVKWDKDQTFKFIALVNKGTCSKLVNPVNKNPPMFDPEYLTMSLKDYLYGVNPIELKNSYVLNFVSIGGDQKIYPLSNIGNYWNELLEKNNITKTPIGENLVISTEVTRPIYFKANFNNQIEFTKYLEDALDYNRFDKNVYDYLVPIYIPFPCYSTRDQIQGVVHYHNPYKEYQTNCSTDNTSKGERATVSQARKIAYVDSKMFTLPSNRTFVTIAHELGHLLFNLDDTYTEELSGVQYPFGVYSPDFKNNIVNNQPKQCLMSERFVPPTGTVQLSKDKKSFFVNTLTGLEAQELRKLNISSYSIDNPFSLELCDYDISLLKHPDGFSGKLKQYGTFLVEPSSEVLSKSKSINIEENIGEYNIPLNFIKKYVNPYDNKGTTKFLITFKSLGMNNDAFEVLLNGRKIISGQESISFDRNKVFDNRKNKITLKIKDNFHKNKSRRFVIINLEKSISSESIMREDMNTVSYQIDILDND